MIRLTTSVMQIWFETEPPDILQQPDLYSLV